MSLSAGDRLGRYEVVAPIGAGGMGEVYRARDSVLDRDVAVKVLLPEVGDDPGRLERFEREARAVAALKHPNILEIYDFGSEEGRPFAVTELLEGRSLHEEIWGGGKALSWERAAEIGSAIAEGLAAAHHNGVIHRDLKPGNIFLCTDGRIKILDFGLARLLPTGRIAPDSIEETLSQLGLPHPAGAGGILNHPAAEPLTRTGTVMGTVGYMAPEQVRGQPADHRSDIFALGCVLYEMVAAKNPFKRDTGVQTLSAILEDEPEDFSVSGIDVPADYQTAVRKCLEKDPRSRYGSSSQVSESLRICITPSSTQSAIPRWWIPAACVVLTLMIGGLWFWWSQRGAEARWARSEALPEITRLTEDGDIYEAYRLARKAQVYLPDNAELKKMVDRITLPQSIVTEPPGATIHIKGYRTPDAPWELLGTTPLQTRLPYALRRMKISKDGYEDFVGAPFGERPFSILATEFPLEPIGSRPPGMVRIPGGPVKRPEFPAVEIDAFWLDRYEVTNLRFKEFVDAGGYLEPRYWTEEFVENGRSLERTEAMDRLRDATGRPGPSGWELGSFGDGREDYPVGGVSWYEAAAYCRYSGKMLPSVYHWHAATSQDQISDILDLSNFGTDGSAPVGSFQGLGDYGTLDMAGNVKEWCWNSVEAKRYILGGAWNTPTYSFKDPDARSPFEREPSHGFRCARLDGPASEAALEELKLSTVFGTREPVTDEIFEVYRRLHEYDPTPLDSEILSVDDSPAHWKKETVSFAAAYGKERVTVLLFLPRDTPPPWQAVIMFPGSDVFLSNSSESLASEYLFDFIPRSGRALIYPIYQGMYERFAPDMLAPNKMRDLTLMWSKDLGRTIEYLETREEIDSTRLAFFGFSLGAIYGPVFDAVQGRFKASILLSGGHHLDAPPEINVVNFAPRSKAPTLMINGRDDFLTPVESAQKPFFDLLGAPADMKRHALLEGGHLPNDRREIIREVLDWFDRHLGPVAH